MSTLMVRFLLRTFKKTLEAFGFCRCNAYKRASLLCNAVPCQLQPSCAQENKETLARRMLTQSIDEELQKFVAERRRQEFERRLRELQGGGEDDETTG